MSCVHKHHIAMFCSVAILAIMLGPSKAMAQMDIDWICITSAKDYRDGVPEGAQPWCFEIWADFVSTGTLDHIELTKPGGSSPFATIYGDESYDSPGSYSSLADLRADYPLGTYTFEFRDSSNALLKTVNLDYSGLPGEPANPVSFTYPSTDGQTDVSINPTLTWAVAGGDGDALMLCVYDETAGQELDWAAPVSMSTTSWTPGPLQNGHQYDLEVSVCEVKDWVGPGWPTMTVGGDEFGCCLMIEYINNISFTTVGEPLWPLQVGQRHEYVRYDTNDPVGWPMHYEITSEATLDSTDYFQLQVWNYDNDSALEDAGYFRSTEDALYAYNPTGEEYLEFQKAPVGTKWVLYQDEAGDWDYKVIEIVAIESVTVPYGTFDTAYKHRRYRCVDPDNLSLGKSPDWYEWIAPGTGKIKEEDYWTDYPPAILELVAAVNATRGPVYRFWSGGLGHHFYTISESERDKLINQYSAVWTYEGTAYHALSDDSDPSASPAHRFWSDRYSGHFYTISESEKNKLITTYSHVWTYEGPAFYAYPEGQQPAGTSPVYRFWSDALNGHFYTMSESEKDKLITTYSDVWTYEGIAWHAYE